MRLKLARTRDPLEVAKLGSTEDTELNFRLRTQSELEAQGTMLGRFFIYGLISPLTVMLVLLVPHLGWWCVAAAIVYISWQLLGLLFEFLFAWQPAGRHMRATIGAVIAFVGFLSLAVPKAPTAHVFLFSLAIAFTVLLGNTIMRQVGTWMAVNMRIDWETSQTWRHYLTRIWKGPIPAECPEILTARAAVAVLTVLAFAGLISTGLPLGSPRTRVILSLLTIILPPPFLWVVWNLSGIVPVMSLQRTLGATGNAFRTWFSYGAGSPTAMFAAGVFRFPTRWCRDPAVRDLATLGIVILLSVGLPPLIPLLPSAIVIPNNADYPSGVSLLNAVGDEVSHGGGNIVISFLLVFFGPTIFIFGYTWFVFGSLLARYEMALEDHDAYLKSKTNTEWDNAVNRLVSSNDEREKRHLFLGIAIFGGYPVLLDRKLLNEHAHLTGDTGAGKTSLGIAPMITQLIAAQDCSVIVLDLKGDMALFETARLEAERSRRPFKWFTNVAERSSFAFNPFLQTHFPTMNPNQQTQTVLQALSLDYGEAYGRGFYSAMNEVVLLNYLKHFQLRSFRELHRLLSDQGSYGQIGESADWKNARHLAALVSRLASIPALNRTPEELATQPEAFDERIDVGETLRNSQVNYFYLASALEPNSATAIAKMVLYSLFTAAARRKKDQTKQVYLVVDEFQRIVSDSVEIVLQLARSMNISFIIAHQSTGQLKGSGIDVTSTVESCTAVKQIFRVSSPDEVRKVVEASGNALYHTAAWRQKIDPSSFDDDADDSFDIRTAEEGMVQVTEVAGPRLERNTVIELSADPQSSFVRFTSGSGYTQFSGYFVPITTPFHISEKNYDDRNIAEWPDPTAAAWRNPLESGVRENDDIQNGTTPRFNSNFDWESRLAGEGKQPPPLNGADQSSSNPDGEPSEP